MNQIEQIELEINRLASRHIGRVINRSKDHGSHFTSDQVSMIKAQFRMMQDDVCDYIEDIILGDK